MEHELRSGEQIQFEVLTSDIIQTRPADIDQIERRKWINCAAEAIRDMTTMHWELFAQIHLKLSPGVIQGLYECDFRASKVF